MTCKNCGRVIERNTGRGLCEAYRTYTVNVPADLDAELTGLMARLNTTADDVVRMAISLLLLAERGQLRVKMGDGTARQVTLEKIRGEA